MDTQQVILITGSSRGIGAATARAAVAHGHRVVLHGSRPTEALTTLAAELDAPWFHCDVADGGAVERAVDRVRQDVGPIDALINNAGATLHHGSILSFTDDEWIDGYSVNFLGAVRFCRSLVPYMIERGRGSVVNVSSVGGISTTTRPRIATYAAAKAAMITVTAAMAKEFAPTVRVNAVAPGFTATDISAGWNEQAWRDAATCLLARVAEPSEVAEVVLFLAGSSSSFVTGQTWVVDGGLGLS